MRSPSTKAPEARRTLLGRTVTAAVVGLLVVADGTFAAGVAAPRADLAALQPPGWVRPAPGDVLRPFEPPAARWSAGHRGVDLAAGPGEPVRSPADGTVAFAGRVAGKPVVVVAHAGGLRSTFEPATATAPRGAGVRAGEMVAHVGGEGAPIVLLPLGVG